MARDALVFGWRTAVLGLAAVQMAALGFSLARAGGAANRMLAALLLVIIGQLTPFIIGFAGFYDRWPWLSFAPFAIPLALAPLIYAYAHALVRGSPPKRLWRHLTPAAIQFSYLAVCFCLPLPVKTAWDESHTAFLEPLTDVAVLGGLVGYSIASLRLLTRYRAWLASARSDDDRFAARWLTRALAAVVATVTVWIGYQAWDSLVAPLDYFHIMGLYLVLAALGLFLAIEGWRHAGLLFPPMGEAAAETEPAAGRDWRALGEAFAARTREAGWATEADLSLAILARRLGTNTSHLSRALNEGLGVGFSPFVNGLRAEAVAEALRRGERGDLLALGLEAGFASKASFNRAFKAAMGVTPSAYRAQVSDSKSLPPGGELRRAGV